MVSHKAQDDLLAWTDVQFLTDFLGKNNLSFGGCLYNGHAFYPGKKVLLYTLNMTEPNPFVKMTVLLRDRELVATVEEERFRWAKYIIGTETIDSRYCGHSDEREKRDERDERIDAAYTIFAAVCIEVWCRKNPTVT